MASEIGSTEDFIKLLRESGYKINSSTQKNKRFLSGNITAININDDTICVYEYKNNQQMEEDLNTISGLCSNGTEIPAIFNKIYQ